MEMVGVGEAHEVIAEEVAAAPQVAAGEEAVEEAEAAVEVAAAWQGMAGAEAWERRLVAVRLHLRGPHLRALSAVLRLLIAVSSARLRLTLLSRSSSTRS